MFCYFYLYLSSFSSSDVLVSCFFSPLFPFRCHQSSLRTYAEAGPSLLNRHFYPSPLTVRVSFYTAGDRVWRLLWMAVFPYSVAAFWSVVVPCYSLLARVVRGGFRRLGVPFSFRSIVSPPCSPCCSPSCSPLFLYLILTSSTLIGLLPFVGCCQAVSAYPVDPFRSLRQFVYLSTQSLIGRACRRFQITDVVLPVRSSRRMVACFSGWTGYQSVFHQQVPPCPSSPSILMSFVVLRCYLRARVVRRRLRPGP